MVIGWASGVCLLTEMLVGSNNDGEELILKTLHCYLFSLISSLFSNSKLDRTDVVFNIMPFIGKPLVKI